VVILGEREVWDWFSVSDPDWMPVDPDQKDKNDQQKKGKSEEILCFEVLDVLFGRWGA
jgi:hypothetical protein